MSSAGLANPLDAGNDSAAAAAGGPSTRQASFFGMSPAVAALALGTILVNLVIVIAATGDVEQMPPVPTTTPAAAPSPPRPRPVDTSAQAALGYEANSGGSSSSGGWAALPPDDTEFTTVAFGSCANQAFPQPFWDTLSALRPQLMILGGDNVYGDCLGKYAATPDEDCDELAAVRVQPMPFHRRAFELTARSNVPNSRCLGAQAYDALQGHPSFVGIKGQLPMVAAWDDHDVRFSSTVGGKRAR